jgi:capsular polysaccharide biosynthesis protein
VTAIIAMAVAIGIAVVAIVSDRIIKPTQQLPVALLLMRRSKTGRHKKNRQCF